MEADHIHRILVESFAVDICQRANAKCLKRASYTWKSILHGRDLLKEGLVWSRRW